MHLSQDANLACGGTVWRLLEFSRQEAALLPAPLAREYQELNDG